MENSFLGGEEDINGSFLCKERSSRVTKLKAFIKQAIASKMNLFNINHFNYSTKLSQRHLYFFQIKISCILIKDFFLQQT